MNEYHQFTGGIHLSGADDFDNMCAVNADLVWAVLNRSGNMPGVIFRVGIEKDRVVKDEWTPPDYQYEKEKTTMRKIELQSLDSR